MPTRTLTCAILLFWAASSAWFVAREIVPKFRASDTPPFTIELADEALQQKQSSRWYFLRNGQRIGIIKTDLDYDEDSDTFLLTAQAGELSLARIGSIEIVAKSFHDRLAVTREGQLRSLSTSVELEARGLGADLQGRMVLTSVVRGRELHSRASFDSPIFGHHEPVIAPTPAPTGSVLNPMHPVPRITGLKPGQSWNQPMIDPRGEVMRAVIGQWLGQNAQVLSTAPPSLVARVESQPQDLEWNAETHACWVIIYQGEEYIARTWVRQSDGLVLRQEAEGHGESLVLQRE